MMWNFAIFAERKGMSISNLLEVKAAMKTQLQVRQEAILKSAYKRSL